MITAFLLTGCDTPDPRDTAEGCSVVPSNYSEGEHTCPDLPWVAVEVGYEVACGIHEGGCVECWGWGGWSGRYSAFYDEPDVVAVRITLRAGWYDSREEWQGPFACVEDEADAWSCFGDLGTMDEVPSLEEAAVAAVADPFMAVLSHDGHLVLGGASNPVEIDGVDISSGIFAGGQYACGKQAEQLVCWNDDQADDVVDLGSASEWSQYATEDDHFAGVRPDGSVVVVHLAGGGEYRRSYPAAMVPWVSARARDVDLAYATNAEGYTYDLNALDAGPVLPEPTTVVDLGPGGLCGVTARGLIECTGEYAEEFPPPGSYVVGGCSATAG